MSDASNIFSGLKVVDLASYIAGPAATLTRHRGALFDVLNHRRLRRAASAAGETTRMRWPFRVSSVRRLHRAGYPDDSADNDRGADQQAAARRLHEQP